MEVDESDDELQKLKIFVKTKDKMIKDLTEGKVILAKELAEAQEKNNIIDGASVEKCLKLTKDLKKKSAETKAFEKERDDLKLSLSKCQTEMSTKNNKIAEVEALNVKVTDFNNKMYEICKTRGVFESLNEVNEKELKSQKEVFDKKAEAKVSENPRHGNIPKRASKASNDNTKKGHCWFFENGFCRKASQCPFLHPEAMCSEFWSQGACSQGEKCQRRHPVQVCVKYLNNSCIAGNKCAHQHPQANITQPRSHPSPSSSPAPSTTPSSTGSVGPNVNSNQNFPNNTFAQSFQPTAHPQMYAQPRGSPARQAGQDQRYDRHDQQQPQGNEYSHQGYQQGPGWHQ